MNWTVVDCQYIVHVRVVGRECTVCALRDVMSVQILTFFYPEAVLVKIQ